MKRLSILHASLALSLLCAAASPAGANLIANGDFESTTVNGSVPDGWHAFGFRTFSPAAYTGDFYVPPASGAWALDLGPSGNDLDNGGTITQTFNVSSPGTYVFSFDYTNEAHSTALADFSWYLSGAITASDTFLNVGGGYQTFSQAYWVGAAGDVTVGFSDMVGNGHGHDAVIDNVSFAAVPEPSSYVLCLLGMFGVALHQRRRQAERRLASKRPIDTKVERNIL